MSTAEIKRTIEEMSPTERFFAASYLTVLLHRDDPEYRAMLAERMTRIGTGSKRSYEDLLQAHAALDPSGGPARS